MNFNHLLHYQILFYNHTLSPVFFGTNKIKIWFLIEKRKHERF